MALVLLKIDLAEGDGSFVATVGNDKGNAEAFTFHKLSALKKFTNVVLANMEQEWIDRQPQEEQA